MANTCQLINSSWGTRNQLMKNVSLNWSSSGWTWYSSVPLTGRQTHLLEVKIQKIIFFFQLENQNSNQNFGWEILNIPIPVVIFYQISVYHFLSGAPWWVTWCLRRYHLFFTFFWQISHWSSFPTVCMFNMCWNKRLLNSLDWLKR